MCLAHAACPGVTDASRCQLALPCMGRYLLQACTYDGGDKACATVSVPIGGIINFIIYAESIPRAPSPPAALQQCLFTPCLMK